MALSDVLSSIAVAADYWLLSDKLSAVEGFLDPIEGYALALLAEHGPGAGTIVEIGSYAGRSTCYLAHGSKRARREKVVAVDHFLGSPEHQPGGGHDSSLVAKGSLYDTFKANLESAGVNDWVHVIKAGSAEAVKGWSHPVRLLFIDGDHSYEESRRDFESWSPWLVSEGIAVFHDIGIFDGVTRFYEELTASGAASEIMSVGTLRAVSLARS